MPARSVEKATPVYESRTRMTDGRDLGMPPILVWQMGKVGSMSMVAALSAAGISAVHVHVLNPSSLAQRRRRRADAGLPPIQQHEEADRLAPLIADRQVGFRVVSGVRDPIAQHLSAVFQKWDDFPPCSGVDKTNPASVAQWFIETCDPDAVATWFEDEFEVVFGVDVYAMPFDRDAKSLRLKAGRLDLLVLRCEDSNVSKQASLNDFFGRGDLRLANENLAASKPQGDLYAEVRNRIRMPAALVERFLATRWVGHFYAREEIQAMRTFWTKADAN